MDALKKLQDWYQSNCDGEWEHGFGVTIETLDNPGWSVKINLEDTNLEVKSFQEIKVDNSDEDWIFCCVKDKKFLGHGDPQKLERILQIFLEWSKT